ncbi:hypothetical protein NC651_014966 [Populus alba x Populus x berolinensis]|nr:hypothetical protein NC651_014966 [Populus alba x Populus x berolinensis]
MATVIIKRLAPSPFALITVLVTLAAFFFSSRFPFKPINTSPQQQELNERAKRKEKDTESKQRLREAPGLWRNRKKEEVKQHSCNSSWKQGKGGEVWCNDGFPRLVQRPLEIALTGKMSKQCACFKEDQLSLPRVEVYEGCDHLAEKCRV